MIFVHTDYYKYFLHNYNKHKILNKNIINNKMLKEIKDISNKVIIPTYNYDFGKNGFFKLLEDKSQVGSFSDYIRKKFKKNRSTVPMFSSCSLFKRKAINLSEVIDPFGKDSDFDLLIQKRGKIIFFGSEFAPTFIIFIEKNIPGGVPYRFNKIFKGSIYFKSEKKKCKLVHYARLKRIKIIYDLKKIENRLKKKLILKQKKTKSGFIYQELDAVKFFNWSKIILKKDPFYFLSSKSKKFCLKYL